MPALGSPTKPSRGLSAEILPVPLEPCTVWWGSMSSSHPKNRSWKRSLSIGPYSTSCAGSPMGASSTARVNLEMKSSWTDSWTITVPKDVQRWPAVPKPENRAPSTARSRSASGMTTRGFLPPSSRQGDCMCLPQSSPILFRTFGLHHVQDAVGKAAGHEESCQRVADGGGVFGGLPDNGVAAGEGGDQVPRGDRDGEVAGRDDGRDADRDAEGEELFVWHLRGDGLAVEPTALTGKEVAGVNYLLHLAERLPVRLADLTGHQPRERLLVVFDDAPDLLYYLRADGGRHSGPLPLRFTSSPTRLYERPCVTERHLGHRLGRKRRVRRSHTPAGRAVGSAAPYYRGHGTGL